MRPTLLELEARTLLSTIVVNNPTDTPVAGETDLRQAIVLANTNGGAETITFDKTVFNTPQTINLNPALGQLELSDPTGTETITGPSASELAISGDGCEPAVRDRQWRESDDFRSDAHGRLSHRRGRRPQCGEPDADPGRAQLLTWRRGWREAACSATGPVGVAGWRTRRGRH